jgi:hypothetical protein
MTPQDPAIEAKLNKIQLSAGNILPYMDGYKKGGSNKWYKLSLDDVVELINEARIDEASSIQVIANHMMDRDLTMLAKILQDRLKALERSE